MNIVVFETILKIAGYIFGKIQDREKAEDALAKFFDVLGNEAPKHAELRKRYQDKRAEMEATYRSKSQK